MNHPMNYRKAIRLNPQLKAFKQIYFGKPVFDMSILQSTIDHFQNLETFEVSYHHSDFSNYNGHPLHFDNVKKVSLCLYDYVIGRSMPNIPLSFGKLQELNFTTNFSMNDAAFLNFIDKHPNIRKLTMDWLSTPSNINASILAKALPQLNEIHIKNCIFLSKGAIRFMEQFKLLKKISFHLRDSQSNEFKKWLGNQWTHAFNEGDRMELERVV